MKPSITIHLGTEKTGTTSIQNMLMDSGGQLRLDGVLFPSSVGAPCHFHLTACVLGDIPEHPLRRLLGITNQEEFDKFRKKTIDGLKEEAYLHSPRRIIISDEHISAHLSTAKLLSDYRDLCETFGEIDKVIVYFRRPDLLRLSLVSEALKSGSVSKFDYNNLLPVFDKLPFRLNSALQLSLWIDTFGAKKIISRKFGADTLLGNDARLDFCHQIQLDESRLATGRRKSNSSIDGRIVKWLFLITKTLNSMNNSVADRIQFAIIQRCLWVFNGPGIVLPREMHVEYLQQFDDITTESEWYDKNWSQKPWREVTKPMPLFKFIIKLLIGRRSR